MWSTKKFLVFSLKVQQIVKSRYIRVLFQNSNIVVVLDCSKVGNEFRFLVDAAARSSNKTEGESSIVKPNVTLTPFNASADQWFLLVTSLREIHPDEELLC